MLKKSVLLLSCVMSSFSLYAGTCTYTLDATQAQLTQIVQNYIKFPTVNLAEQNAIVTLPQSLNAQSNFDYRATSSVGANSMLLYKNGQTSVLADKAVVNHGIVAVEYEFDVNALKVNLGNEEQADVGFEIAATSGTKTLISFVPKFTKGNNTSSNLSQKQYLQLSVIYHKTPEQNSTLDNKFVEVVIPVDGKLRIGTYFNQSSKQVGYILNGVNYGYLSTTYDAAITNLHFFPVVSAYVGTNTALAGKTLSAKLVTNKNQMIFTYPTGTTDICGNAS